MRRLSRIVVLLLLVELVIGAAIGTRIRKQLESPVRYLGSGLAAQPLHVGQAMTPVRHLGSRRGQR
jgi:hypothetical protein